jgi:glycolate oxidase iron-sulfur subunit
MEESSLCCGSAGVYNVLHPQQAAALLERKLDHAQATGATTIVTANPGCLLQLAAGLAQRGSAVRVRHLIDVLDEAYSRAEATAEPLTTVPGSLDKVSPNGAAAAVRAEPASKSASSAG